MPYPATRTTRSSAFGAWRTVKRTKRASAPAATNFSVSFSAGNVALAVPTGRNARASVETLRSLKMQLTFHEYDCGHEITAEALRDLSNFLTEKVLEPIVQP